MVEPLFIDLESAEYVEKFENAELFVKTSPVMVEEVTAEGLENGAYADKGVALNEEGQFVLNTIVMEQVEDADGNITRVPKIEAPYVLEPGNFIVTNPVWHEGDSRNHFVQKNAEKIAKLYEPVSDDDSMEGFSFGEGELPGVAMRPKGYHDGTTKRRLIIKNDTGRKVEIRTLRGSQIGSPSCYFVKGSGENDRPHILSQNDFKAYELYKAPKHRV
ncbi:hypothetical protein FWF93_00400 [Candidatus Saccharibacteria bacterium]|nr:hypothetical protein [Candidatus Saccharibacteria bacterium]